LAEGRRGHRAGTQLRRLNLVDLSKLATPVSHSAVVEKVPSRLRTHVAARLDSGGILAPASFGAVIDAVRELLSEPHPLLDRFSAKRRAQLLDIPEKARWALALQKESLATALELAGLDRLQLREWQPDVNGRRPTSFLDGLPEARLREDAMVVNDFVNFPGLALMRTMPHASAVFSDGHVTLTVMMANRQPLEEQLGADLVYCNETYGSFVVVQYKAMEQEPGGALFRLPNKDLEEEILRMDAVWTELAKCAPDRERRGFRLTEKPFFLKLCPRIVFDPDDASLVKGMYLPLDYFRRFEADPAIGGPRRGKVVTYDNVGRYFDNTSFASLVAGGWIGTTLNQSSKLEAAIRDILRTGRTVTFAVRSETPPGGAAPPIRQRNIVPNVQRSVLRQQLFNS
jgi:hypothetical protein